MNTLTKPFMPNYQRGQNPNSKDNLTYHEGRPVIWDEPTKTHGITVTDSAWDGLKKLVKSKGYRSVSDLIEIVGRDYIDIPEKEELDL
jgi:hypothetical protein